MNRNRLSSLLPLCLVLAALTMPGQYARAHGGVMFEDDVCVIKLGFLTAHFTIYQPATRASEEFCEDIPDVADAIFVLDYLHDSMKEMPVEFRILRDVTGLGLYATWEDVAALENIERDTVLYRDPAKEPDAVLTVDHTFDEAGGYIGIVTARHPTLDRTYSAVFPFRVGGTGPGFLPLFLTLGVTAQFLYWLSNGTLARWTAKLVGSRG
ncbi:MAG TPA: hypothetical protein VIV14_01870 [Gammaproteobacteria bacterium]